MNRRNFFSMLCGVLAPPFVPVKRDSFRSTVCGMFGKLKHRNLVRASAGELANSPLVTVSTIPSIKIQLPDYYMGKTDEIVRDMILPEIKRVLRKDVSHLT